MPYCYAWHVKIMTVVKNSLLVIAPNKQRFKPLSNNHLQITKCKNIEFENLIKELTVEQILLIRLAMLNGIDCLVRDGWQADLRRY